MRCQYDTSRLSEQKIAARLFGISKKILLHKKGACSLDFKTDKVCQTMVLSFKLSSGTVCLLRFCRRAGHKEKNLRICELLPDALLHS